LDIFQFCCRHCPELSPGIPAVLLLLASSLRLVSESSPGRRSDDGSGAGALGRCSRSALRAQSGRSSAAYQIDFVVAGVQAFLSTQPSPHWASRVHLEATKWNPQPQVMLVADLIPFG
jgi:hypothetical protein